MELRPGEHQAWLSTAESARDHLQRLDQQLRAANRVAGVEVRGS